MKKYLLLLLGLVNIFLIGGYVTFVLYGIKEVTPMQWTFTSLFAIFFIGSAIQKFKEKK